MTDARDTRRDRAVCLGGELLEERRLLTITVDTLLDEADGSIVDGDVSLRDAILVASGGETIDFSVNGTILLTLGELRINDDITIDGPGADLLTIDASGNDLTPGSSLLDGDPFNDGDGSRVFHLDDNADGANRDVTIQGVTLTGGDEFSIGGAILSRENLTLTDSVVTGNVAQSAGGGIFDLRYTSGGTTTIERTTISANEASYGAGAVLRTGYYGSTTLSESTISGNSATHSGGGLWIRTDYAGTTSLVANTISANDAQYGGGVWNSTYSLNEHAEIASSTVSGNSASGVGGGIFNYNGRLEVGHSTITQNDAPSGNGSGVASFGDVYTATDAQSSIIAGNMNSDVDLVGGAVQSFVSSGYNLIGTGTGTSAFGGSDTTLVADPLLGGLADNGGPTLTHAPVLGSPVLDAGDPAAMAGVGQVPDFDQRGVDYPRVLNGRIDIGAVEQLLTNTITVNTLVDEADGSIVDGDVSLRDGIAAANPGDEIDFSVTGTILLTLGELVIDKELTIIGPGADVLTIDASGNDPTPEEDRSDGSRVFNVNDDDGDTLLLVEIQGLSITGGDASGEGGGVYNREHLAVVESEIAYNHGSFDGGGVMNYGRFELDSSTLAYNVAGHWGGGLASRTDLDGTRGSFIINSTISRNEAFEHHGIDNLVGFMSIAYSTVYENGSFDEFRNGDGVTGSSNFALTEVYSSIIAGHESEDVALHMGASNSFVSLGFNIIGTGDAEALDAFDDMMGDQIGVDSPRLGPLVYNGGPTRTHALWAGSPAIDAGNMYFPPDTTYDQRGAPYLREFDGDQQFPTIVDIGAYEMNYPDIAPGEVLVVDALIDEMDTDFGPGDFSLREALAWANGVVGGQTIEFAPALSGGTITLALDELKIGDSIVIDATSLPGGLTIDASGNDPTPETDNGDGSRVFNIDESDNTNHLNVELRGLMLTGGDVGGPGGAVYSLEGLHVIDSVVTGNFATERGGGIYAFQRGGSGSIIGSVISHNSSLARGGGMMVFAAYSDLTISDSLVTDNFADEIGGAFVAVLEGVLEFTDSEITGNTAVTSVGGAHILASDESSIHFGRNTVTLNQAVSGGIGGLFADAFRGAVTVSDTVIESNSTGGNAGGVWFEAGSAGGNLVIERTVVSNNTAGASGGGMLGVFGAPTQIVDSSVFGNHAGELGGGAYIRTNTFGGPPITVNMTGTTISGNSADGNGGGVYFKDTGGQVTTRHTTITGNTADADNTDGGTGGGVFLYTDSDFGLDHTIVAGNGLGDGGDSDVAGDLNDGSSYNLIGVETGLSGISHGTNGNQIGTAAAPIDPLVGPLADNGGPILPGGNVLMTHALLAGSPAMDAGDPAAMAGAGNVPEFDQRGDPFGRVLGAAIDMGAYEAAAAAGIPGDGNLDGVVDGLDYIIWALNFGDDPADVPPDSPGNGDYNDDGAVDGLDYVVWASNFGTSNEPLAGDGNLDGAVDGLDYILWASNFGDDPADDPPGSPENGDYNDDGAVNGLDYIVWASNFGISASPGVALERAARDAVFAADNSSGTATEFSSIGSLAYSGDDANDVTAAVDAIFARQMKKNCCL